MTLTPIGVWKEGDDKSAMPSLDDFVPIIKVSVDVNARIVVEVNMDLFPQFTPQFKRDLLAAITAEFHESPQP